MCFIFFSVFTFLASFLSECIYLLFLHLYCYFPLCLCNILLHHKPSSFLIFICIFRSYRYPSSSSSTFSSSILLSTTFYTSHPLSPMVAVFAFISHCSLLRPVQHTPFSDLILLVPLSSYIFIARSINLFISYT